MMTWTSLKVIVWNGMKVCLFYDLTFMKSSSRQSHPMENGVRIVGPLGWGGIDWIRAQRHILGNEGVLYLDLGK